jgi:transketolase
MDAKNLSEIAQQIRESVVTSLFHAQSGHLGGSLGLADIMTAFYFNILNHQASQPKWDQRDRMILSIGHVAPVWYAALAHSGYFPVSELNTLRKLGSRLQGHPSIEHQLPGVELAAGSLGQGLSVAVGLALGAKMDQKEWFTYCILGDGELQEGSVWEAAMSASHHRLNQLIAVVDRNGLQIDGKTESVMSLEPLADKWAAFGWNVLSCDGNDIDAFIKTVHLAKGELNKPTVIIANTTMGQGVPSIEGDYRWHGKAPNQTELDLFLSYLNSDHTSI